MTICEKYYTCEMYRTESQTCNENSIAVGYCGERKNEVSPLKDNQTNNPINPMLVSVFYMARRRSK